MAEYSISGWFDDTEWSWDQEQGLQLRRQGLISEDYPVAHPRLPRDDQRKQTWLESARILLEWSLYHHLPAETLPPQELPPEIESRSIRPTDILSSSGEQPVYRFQLLWGLYQIERAGIRTILYDVFRHIETGPQEIPQLIARLLYGIDHKIERMIDAVKAVQDKLDLAVDALADVGRQIVAVRGQQARAASEYLESHLPNTWARLSDESKEYLANGQALYDLAWQSPDEWDWGLSTIQFGKALEDVLRLYIGRLALLLLDGDPISLWSAQRKPNARRAALSRMDIGEFADFLQWVGPNPQMKLSVQSKLKSALDRTFIFSDLPALLRTLNDYRNHAAHAGAKVKESEAREMYRQVIGSGENTSLIARLVNLVPQ